MVWTLIILKDDGSILTRYLVIPRTVRTEEWVVYVGSQLSEFIILLMSGCNWMLKEVVEW